MGGDEVAAAGDALGFTDVPLQVIQLSDRLLKYLHVPPKVASGLRPVFACSVSRFASGGLKSWLSRALVVTETGQVLLFDTKDGRVTHEASLRLQGPIPASEESRPLVHMVLEAQGLKTKTTTTIWLRITVNDSSPFAAVLRFQGAFEMLPTALLRVIRHFVPSERVVVRKCMQQGPISKFIPKELHSIPRAKYGSGGAAAAAVSGSSRGIPSTLRSSAALYMMQAVLEERKRLKVLRAETEKRRKAQGEAVCAEKDETMPAVPPLVAEEFALPHDRSSSSTAISHQKEAHSVWCDEEGMPQSPPPVDGQQSEPSLREHHTPAEVAPSEALWAEEVEAPLMGISPPFTNNQCAQPSGGVLEDSSGAGTIPTAAAAAPAESSINALGWGGPPEKIEPPGQAPPWNATGANGDKELMPDAPKEEEEEEEEKVAVAELPKSVETKDDESWNFQRQQPQFAPMVETPPASVECGADGEKREDPLLPACVRSDAVVMPAVRVLVDFGDNGSAIPDENAMEFEGVNVPPPLPPPAFLRRDQDRKDNALLPPVNGHSVSVESSAPNDATAINLTPLQEDLVAGALRANGDNILSVYSPKHRLANYRTHALGVCDEDRAWRCAYEGNVGRKSEARGCRKPVTEMYSRGVITPLHQLGASKYTSARVAVDLRDPHCGGGGGGLAEIV